MSDPRTPSALAQELGVSDRRIRLYLRQTYGKLDLFTHRWHLDAAQAADVRAHFTGGDPGR